MGWSRLEDGRRGVAYLAREGVLAWASSPGGVRPPPALLITCERAPPPALPPSALRSSASLSPLRMPLPSFCLSLAP